MHFGLQFFPDAGPDEKSAQAYWNEALHLVELADTLGYTHVRTVEHYFDRYGGYSTNPIVFLAAASQRTAKARLVTGALLPIFNHPLKMAGEIAMLDAISNGRIEPGFARAFLPHEFRRFNRSLDESHARFEEGVEQVRRLLEEEHVTSAGHFHSFTDVTSLPRPVQQPRPPFWVASTSTPESFVRAGRNGYWLMSIPRDAAQMRHLVGLYRQAWREAGHPGNGWVMMTFQMYCEPDTAAAVETYRRAGQPPPAISRRGRVGLGGGHGVEGLSQPSPHARGPAQEQFRSAARRQSGLGWRARRRDRAHRGLQRCGWRLRCRLAPGQ